MRNPGGKKLRTGEVAYLWISRVIVWAAIAVSIFPTLWVVTASLQPGDAFFSNTLIPSGLTLRNYELVLEKTRFLLWLRNSLILGVSVGLGQMLITASAAYAFSRLRFPGRKYGLMTLLLIQMFPNFMSLSAVYAIAVKLGMLDSFWALALIFMGATAFNIWLLKGYVDSLPRELDEAAFVDGATHWQVFTRIILPLSRPMLVVMFLFAFMGVYAEFILTSALIKSPQNYTIALGLRTFVQNQFAARWTQFAAAAVMASAPVVVMWMFLQRHVAAGLARGAVKG